MIPKWFIWFSVIIGSLIGSFVPALWGAGIFSFSSVIFSGIGAIIGIFVAIKIGNSI